MLREEFEARMGNTVTPEAWDDIVDLYSHCHDIEDWDAFADDYKLHGCSKILDNVWRRLKNTRDVLDIYKREHQEAAELLIKLHADFGIQEAYDMAESMIYMKGIIRYKMENGKELTDREKEYIISKL